MTVHVDVHLNDKTRMDTKPIEADYQPFATLDIFGAGDDKVMLFVHDEATVDLLEDAVARLREALRTAQAGSGSPRLVA